MEKKVFEILKPKVASLGFSKEELQGVSANIAKTLQTDATDEQIASAVDAIIPFLQLSQSASNRSFERYKEQFLKDHQTEPSVDKDKPKKEEPKPDGQLAELLTQFKEFRENTEKTIKEQMATIELMKAEKTNESLMKSAIEGLKDVDPNYYSIMLDGRTFASEDDMTAFVGKVKAGWDNLCKERDIKDLKNLTPPGGGYEPETVSDLVQGRIDERAKVEVPSAIKGL